MKEKYKKIGRWVLIVVGTIVVTMFILGALVESVPSLKEGLEWGIYYQRIAPYTKEEERLDALRKADTFGGKTPEETLNMYIDALKKSDVELASKYVVVENQADLNKRLKQVVLDEGSLTGSLKAAEVYLGGKKDCTKTDSCLITYSYITTKNSTTTIYAGDKIDHYQIRPAGTKVTTYMGFSLNNYTNVWKISN